jgi:hypothetical protein
MGFHGGLLVVGEKSVCTAWAARSRMKSLPKPAFAIASAATQTIFALEKGIYGSPLGRACRDGGRLQPHPCGDCALLCYSYKVRIIAIYLPIYETKVAYRN